MHLSIILLEYVRNNNEIRDHNDKALHLNLEPHDQDRLTRSLNENPIVLNIYQQLDRSLKLQYQNCNRYSASNPIIDDVPNLADLAAGRLTE